MAHFCKPQPHRVDARALAVLRILLSLFILHDIYQRLEHGRISLAWYTSCDDGTSILARSDSPHGSPVHKIWFYRGSAGFQICLFVITIMLSLLFGIGYRCQTISILLWAFVNSMQNRSPHLADGSDSYLRNILLWCTVCPVGQVWSLDAMLNRTRKEFQLIGRKKKSDVEGGSTQSIVQTVKVVQSIGTLGLTLQVFLMYYGAVYRRFSGTMWMPPKFTAVYYVLNNAFASRQYAADLARAHPDLTRLMTAGGLLIELICPLACILGSCDDKKSWRHVPAGILAVLHLQLYACMRLFNWQFVSIIACVVFIPTQIWDRWTRWTGVNGSDVLGTTPSTHTKRPKQRPKSKAKTFISSFFLFYMLYNWMGERRWIAKHDGGDIGEFLRFNQNWLMYGPNVSRESMVALITGKIQSSNYTANASDNKKNGVEAFPPEQGRIDIMKAIRTKDWGIDSEISDDTYRLMRQELPGDMAARYPSWRWEVAIKDWVQEKVKPKLMTPAKRVERFGRTLCFTANQNEVERVVTHVELAFWFVRTVEYGTATMDHRFDRIRNSDLVIEVACQ